MSDNNSNNKKINQENNNGIDYSNEEYEISIYANDK
jgi:hypothetical protein